MSRVCVLVLACLAVGALAETKDDKPKGPKVTDLVRILLLNADSIYTISGLVRYQDWRRGCWTFGSWFVRQNCSENCDLSIFTALYNLF